MTSESVLVIGAGISGLACARALQRAGIEPRVVDRGRAAGGRMSGRTLHGRVVDLGASYFTAEQGTPFDTLVQGWVARGLAREWTDTFSTAGPDGIGEKKSGPMRYGSPSGLRDLVIDLGRGLRIEQGTDIDSVSAELEAGGIRYDAVVLAMPDPQALRVLPPEAPASAELADDWEATIAVALGYDERGWAADLHGAFTNGLPSLSFIADDGDRRGDGAPVLVAHSSAETARRHLDDPDAAIPSIVDEVTEALRLDSRPTWTHAHRWTFARPANTHRAPFLLMDSIGVCGDAWSEKSSVGAAWNSGDALGRAIVDRLRG